MRKFFGRLFIACAAVAAMLSANPVMAGVIVDNAPTVGAYWYPLDGTPNGTYVYANSFTFTGSTGTLMDTVGAYMLNRGDGPGTPFQFEVLADSGNSPDPATVLASSNFLTDANTSLALVTAALTSSLALTNGTEYWIALSTVGQASTGSYQFGGYTGPNPGSFWYSNDPAGQNFDGTNLTPQIAIFASGPDSVPEPSSLALLGLGVVALAFGAHRRRRAAAV